MAKHGGIMSSMYNMKSLDNGLSLELSMEINQKLQSVLEDTLLKNIMLKVLNVVFIRCSNCLRNTSLAILQDNLSTLGAEVARISQQYQSLLQQQKQA